MVLIPPPFERCSKKLRIWYWRAPLRCSLQTKCSIHPSLDKCISQENVTTFLLQGQQIDFKISTTLQKLEKWCSANCRKLSKIVKIVKKIDKIVKKFQKLSKIAQIVKIVKICQNCQNLSKLSKIVKIIKNCQKMLKNVKNFQNCQKLSKC